MVRGTDCDRGWGVVEAEAVTARWSRIGCHSTRWCGDTSWRRRVRAVEQRPFRFGRSPEAFSSVAGVVVLGMGAGGGLTSAFRACVALAVVLAWRYYYRDPRWSSTRIGMTHELVERMVGHRTRLAQQQRERWDEGEDGDRRPLSVHIAGDGFGRLFLTDGLPRGWLVVELVLVPAFISGGASVARSPSGWRAHPVVSSARRLFTDGVVNLNARAPSLRGRTPRRFFQASARAEEKPALVVGLTPGGLEEEPTHRRLFERVSSSFVTPGGREPRTQRGAHELERGIACLLEGPSG